METRREKGFGKEHVKREERDAASSDPENGEPRGTPQDSVAQIETISPDPLNEA